MPRQVDFEVSLDGRNFRLAGSVVNEVPEKKNGVIIKDFVKEIQKQEVRYVRIRAHNYGKIPSWHAGHNGAAWIFVDEIVIE